MNKDARRSDWNKPLTKADFCLYQLEKHIGIYTAACWLLFVLGVVTAGGAIYDFLSGTKYYGLDKAFISVLGFLLGGGAFRRFGELRDERRRIQSEALERGE